MALEHLAVLFVDRITTSTAVPRQTCAFVRLGGAFVAADCFGCEVVISPVLREAFTLFRMFVATSARNVHVECPFLWFGLFAHSASSKTSERPMSEVMQDGPSYYNRLL